MAPDPIAPNGTATFKKWWGLIVSVAGGIPVIIGVIVAGVNYLVNERLEEFERFREEQIVELAQTVVDDDIDFQDKKLELLEKRIERLEGMQ